MKASRRDWAWCKNNTIPTSMRLPGDIPHSAGYLTVPKKKDPRPQRWRAADI